MEKKGNTCEYCWISAVVSAVLEPQLQLHHKTGKSPASGRRHPTNEGNDQQTSRQGHVLYPARQRVEL